MVSLASIPRHIALVAAMALLVVGSSGVVSAQTTARPIVVTADVPLPSATVTIPFRVSGWALDRDAIADAGIDSLHVWASAGGGAAPVFLGAAALSGDRPDVAALYGPRFAASGFDLLVTSALPVGSYQVLVYARSTATQEYGAPLVFTVTVCGMALSDLSCVAGQVAAWNGSIWVCSDRAGDQGVQGPAGPAGSAGAAGSNGTSGTNGTPGVDGIQGIQGPAGSVASAFAFVHETDFQAVPAGAAVTWNTNGPLSGITHVAGSGSIVVSAAGTYMIDWKVGYAHNGSSAFVQYGLAVTNVAVPGSAVFVFNPPMQAGTSVIVALAAGDIITLVNQTVVTQYLHTGMNNSPTVGSSVRVLRIQ